ncbi:RNA polymerase II transcriptional coactivator [Blastocystis sp. subtype 4]|uniref:RNA polymerase II transcriptional coactivator n=1 Tax=Blastocystis sp. subtype 4 TaxID=944170 RepID=UPI000711732D|nr:RNA polymerase II transcriptional coactivator [Blastocystis sp. subtype 4]KNB43410.1 RNA polymerase II transcriptional coactivator [Blastocystis sp. subtype 4]|eukprot:XP_014526859.1 RNA polymerase II transcriptional coactivator [Blastocystis sp. subtype 4]
MQRVSLVSQYALRTAPILRSSEPRFDDDNGWMISISSKKAINVAEFRGSPSVSIREYAKLDDGKVVPTKKGIFLTEENYKAMMECEGVVKQLIEKVKKGETNRKDVEDLNSFIVYER